MKRRPTMKRFLAHPVRFLHHAFVPHEGNDHRPYALRPPALKVYSLALISVKVFVTAFLFVTYPSIAEFSTITASRLIQLTNEARVTNGLSPLTESTSLDLSAFRKAQDMIDKDYFAHTGPDGKRPWDWIKETGYVYSLAGENLARDFSDADSTFRALMNSESHRSNILNPRFTEMGASVVYGDGTVAMAMHYATPKIVKSEPAPQPAPAPVSAPQAAPTPAAQPTPAPAPQPAPQPIVLTYIAAVADQSTEALEMDPGTTTEIWIEYRNDGNTEWTNDGDHFFALNVTNPSGRMSAFEHESWNSPYQPTRLDQTRVAPGETGRFTFTIEAPDEPGTYAETFAVVAEGLIWLEGGVVEIPIVVRAPEPAAGPAIEPIPPAETIPAAEPEIQIIETENSIFETLSIPDEPVRGEVLSAVTTDLDESNIQGKILFYSRRFFLFFAAFLGLALILNIIIRIRVQHGPTIVQTVFVLVLSVGLLISRFHFLEQFVDQIRIL